jgi:hypothetical protein
MKKISIILFSALAAIVSCTKSKEVHPEIGDGNDEIVTVGMNDVHVEYTRTDHAELQKVVFHYSLAEVQQFEAAEMTKRETFFELTLNDLLSDTLYDYYYELFYNGGETSITNQKSFHTQAFDTPEPPTPPSGVPEGAINGLFTINANGDQVYFSQGNLQYQASTNTWRFAENQWDYVGDDTYGTVYENGVKCDNALISSTYDGWIDLFGWGTSGFNHGAICYQPWSTSRDCIDYYAYGNAAYSLFDMTGQADWGFNPISNGSNTENFWRCLTMDEWAYVFSTRFTSCGMHYAKANVNGVKGVILLPDNWNVDTISLSNTDIPSASFASNVITREEWNAMESAGAVFLPAAGFRDGSEVGFGNIYGVYWTASKANDWHAKCFTFEEDSFYWQWANYNGRNDGEAVRLVHDAR